MAELQQLLTGHLVASSLIIGNIQKRTVVFRIPRIGIRILGVLCLDATVN
jgi:hypothetical protein